MTLAVETLTKILELEAEKCQDRAADPRAMTPTGLDVVRKGFARYASPPGETHAWIGGATN